jgi:hypothetical protein
LKKQILLLVCGALSVVSCGRNNNENETIKYQMDSAAKASGLSEDEINRKKNDSIIMAIATKHADSIEQVNKKMNTPPPATAQSLTPTHVQTTNPVNKKPVIKEPVHISDPPGAH